MTLRPLLSLLALLAGAPVALRAQTAAPEVAKETIIEWRRPRGNDQH